MGQVESTKILGNVKHKERTSLKGKEKQDQVKQSKNLINHIRQKSHYLFVAVSHLIWLLLEPLHFWSCILVFPDLSTLVWSFGSFIFPMPLNCRVLLARLEYLRETFQIKEGDFLTFDALVQLNLSWITLCEIFYLLSFMIVLHSYPETSCSMRRTNYPFEGRLWHDDFCWQEVCNLLLKSIAHACLTLEIKWGNFPKQVDWDYSNLFSLIFNAWTHTSSLIIIPKKLLRWTDFSEKE